MPFRPQLAEDLTPIQQSVTYDPDDYEGFRVFFPMLGVILAVYPADVEENETAVQTEDRHGFMHQCDVLIVNDSIESYMFLRNVIITPDSLSGIDDYEEHLPRGSSALMSGSEYKDSLQEIDPYDLDGDWCVVEFIGGRLDFPFISRYWPHARNVLDPATSGAGIEGKNLKQAGRYFRRINGVETVINSKGDVVVSTTYANSKIQQGEKPKEGRWARSKDPDVGGSLRCYIKPSQTVELTFEEQVSGIGVIDSQDPELPQKNPPQSTPQPNGEKENTYVYYDREQASLRVPKDFLWETGENTEATIGTDFIIEVGGDASLKAEGMVTLDGEKIKLGENAQDSEPVVKGGSFKTWLLNFTVDSPFGPLKATSAYVETLPSDPAVSKKNFVE